VETDVSHIVLPEGATGSFSVALSQPVAANTTVTVARVSGNPDISIDSGSLLVFGTGNWHQAQTVFLAAGHLAEQANATASIRCSAGEWAPADVTATELYVDGNHNLIPDSWEYRRIGTTNGITQTSDFDHDGSADYAEYVAGTDPTNASSRLEIVDFLGQAPSGVVLVWPSVAARSYAIGRCTNLMENWRLCASNLPATPPANVHTDAPPNGQAGFYRIHVE
jgi:hypothetical protein